MSYWGTTTVFAQSHCMFTHQAQACQCIEIHVAGDGVTPSQAVRHRSPSGLRRASAVAGTLDLSTSGISWMGYVRILFTGAVGDSHAVIVITRPQTAQLIYQ